MCELVPASNFPEKVLVSFVVRTTNDHEDDNDDDDGCGAHDGDDDDIEAIYSHLGR